jgi:hypothetical protein
VRLIGIGVLTAALTLGCGEAKKSAGDQDNGPLETDGNDAAVATPDSSADQDTPSPAGPDTGKTDPQSLPPLHLALTVHLEGWKVDKENVFNKYTQGILEYSELTHQYGARFTWESKNLIGAVETFGTNVFQQLVDAGNEVGVHADEGGKQKPGYDQAKFETILTELNQRITALGVTAKDVSGICSHLDWVTAAINAGFRTATGLVAYCLKALPEDKQPDYVKDCTNPGDCHQPYPSTAAERIHPWRARDGATWTTHDPTGKLVLFPSSGSFVCLHENSGSSESNTGCQWDSKDVDQAMAIVEEALALRDPKKMNQLTFVWSYGKALDKELLKDLLQRIKVHVDKGDIKWQYASEMLAAYEVWEASTLDGTAN